MPNAALGLPSRSTVTDANGRFAFPGVSSGAYLLTGIAQDHLAGIVRATVKPLSTTASETTFVDIAMTPTGKFYGNVTLENATNHQSTIVYVDGSSYVAVTNAAGNYLLEGVPVGSWTVRGTHPGYLDRSVSGSITAAGDSIPLSSFQLPLNSNIPPLAAANNPTSPVSHTPASFSGSGSDDDGTIVRYEWDFDNDGTFDYSSPSTAATTHAYATSGAYTAKLRVTDNQGAIGLDAITFNVVDGVFVSSTGNNANPGTYDQPVATLSQGFVIASTFTRKYVFIGTGTYAETPTFPAGLEIRGGFTPGTTWTRTAGNYSVFNVGLSPAQIVNVSIPTLVSGLQVVASNQVAPGASSIALRVLNSSSAVQFVDCKFTAGNGGNGNNSPSGVAGSSATGAVGPSGGGGGLPGGGNGGAGGGGGGGMGTNGGNFCGSNSGGFGGSTFSCSPGGTGQNGFNSCAVGDGANGSALSGMGTIAGGIWTPAAGNSGANGAGGTGGGGGGGGGNQTTGAFCGVNATGGPGGGGGGGGGYGTGGTGGMGGGASFAVLLYNSSPIFTSCTFTTSNGGAGGSGGNGGGFGLGAGGAAGTAGQPGAGTGGSGAAGNRGGAGGGGGGGAGGVSIGIAVTGTSSPSITGASYTIGIGGTGGSGGFHPVTSVQAPAGPNGATANLASL